MSTEISPAIDYQLERLNRKYFSRGYQPQFEDPEALDRARQELLSMEGITTPKRIDEISKRLGEIATEASNDVLIIAGKCAARIDASKPIDQTIEPIRQRRRIIDEVFEDEDYGVEIADREANQTGKPRTVGFIAHETPPEKEGSQEERDGSEVRIIPEYYGDLVNGRDPDERTEDPARMVESAIQARDICENHGISDFISAHEALLVVDFESAFLVDEDGNKVNQPYRELEDQSVYLTTSDIVWIGNRTRDIDGPQVQFLRKVKNPIGIKIDANITAREIRDLYATLNPKGVAGRLIFTLRLGADSLHKAPGIIAMIEEHAPGSLENSDPEHGKSNNAKVKLNGKGKFVKTRYISDMEAEIRAIHEACIANSTRLNGLHLEASGLDDRIECVQDRNQYPTHESWLDPELNNNQLRSLLEFYRELIRR